MRGDERRWEAEWRMARDNPNLARLALVCPRPPVLVEQTKGEASRPPLALLLPSGGQALRSMQLMPSGGNAGPSGQSAHTTTATASAASA